jgi:hypothetical protein
MCLLKQGVGDSRKAAHKIRKNGRLYGEALDEEIDAAFEPIRRHLKK